MTAMYPFVDGPALMTVRLMVFANGLGAAILGIYILTRIF